MNNSNILINVVTVVFNSQNTIEQTITSVINQSYNNVDYYIIDGMSTDNTISIIKKYNSFITKFICEKDLGIYDAMNKAIDLIKDDNSYILFLNADDYFISNDVLENIVQYFDNSDFIYGKVFLKDASSEFGTYIGKEQSYRSLPHGMIQHQATFTKKSLFLKLGYFDLKYRIVSDYDFALKVFSGDFKTKFINETISVMGMGGVSSAQALTTFNEKIISLKKHYSGIILRTSIFKIKFLEIPRFRISLFLKKYDLLNLWRKIKNLF